MTATRTHKTLAVQLQLLQVHQNRHESRSSLVLHIAPCCRFSQENGSAQGPWKQEPHLKQEEASHLFHSR